MTDTTTQQPLQVSTDGTVGPYIKLPLSQLEDVKRILDTHNIFYWVSENAISWNGGPYVAEINFGRAGNAEAVQKALNAVR